MKKDLTMFSEAELYLSVYNNIAFEGIIQDFLNKIQNSLDTEGVPHILRNSELLRHSLDGCFQYTKKQLAYLISKLTEFLK